MHQVLFGWSWKNDKRRRFQRYARDMPFIPPDSYIPPAQQNLKHYGWLSSQLRVMFREYIDDSEEAHAE